MKIRLSALEMKALTLEQDVFLRCSNGLSDVLEWHQMAEASSIEDTSSLLVEAAVASLAFHPNRCSECYGAIVESSVCLTSRTMVTVPPTT